MRERLLGTLICASGAICMSPDGALQQLLKQWGVDERVLYLWKFVFAALLNIVLQVSAAVYHAATSCESPRPRRATVCEVVRAHGERYIGGVAILSAGMTLSWNHAFMLTSITEVVTLFYLNPIWAILLEVVVRRRTVPCATYVTVAVAAVAVCFTAVSAVAPSSGEEAVKFPASTRGLGNLLALVSGLCMAGQIFVSNQATRNGYHAEGMMLANLLGFLIVVLVQLLIFVFSSDGVSMIPTVKGHEGTWYLVVLGDAATTTVFHIAALLAPRFIPAFAVTLIFMLELVLAPLFGLAINHVAISSWSAGGLLLLFVALATHEVWLHVYPMPPPPPDFERDAHDAKEADRGTRLLSSSEDKPQKGYGSSDERRLFFNPPRDAKV